MSLGFSWDIEENLWNEKLFEIKDCKKKICLSRISFNIVFSESGWMKTSQLVRRKEMKDGRLIKYRKWRREVEIEREREKDNRLMKRRAQ